MLLPFSLLFAFAYLTFRPINEESGQRALIEQIRTDLERHRQRNGPYPVSLSELHISDFPAESQPRMVSQFEYHSDGTTYTLSCVGASTGTKIVRTP